MSPITLRPIEDHDADVLFAFQAHPTTIRMTAFTSRDPRDRHAFVAWLSRARSDKSMVTRTILSGDVVVGSIIASDTGRIPQLTFGIDPARWNQGIATAALIAFTTTMKRRPLQARVADDNLAAIRVLENAGFGHIGTERVFANARQEEIDARLYDLGFFPAPTYKGPPPT